MSSLHEMKTVDLSLCTLTEQLSMFVNHRCQFYLLDQLVSLQTDLWQHFIKVNDAASCLQSDQCGFSTMTSLRRRTIKRFRRQFLNGY